MRKVTKLLQFDLFQKKYIIKEKWLEGNQRKGDQNE